jgi:3-hydroxyacyl-[acyl-carrier-protein] dehydratase
MFNDLPDDALEVFKRATKQRLLECDFSKTLMNREQVMKHLPHRDPILLVDRVVARDPARTLLCAAYDLSRAQAVFAGHFPTQPLYPGVLQVEAVGQAGILAALLRDDDSVKSVELTHILGARFLSPVNPGGELELVAQVLEDGLFLTVVGQSLKEVETTPKVPFGGLGRPGSKEQL